MHTVDTGLQVPVLIGVIVELRMLKSEQVLICKDTEATHMHYFHMSVIAMCAHVTWCSFASERTIAPRGLICGRCLNLIRRVLKDRCLRIYKL